MRTHRAAPQYLQARYFSPLVYLLFCSYGKSITLVFLNVCQAENLRPLSTRYCYPGMEYRYSTTIIFRCEYGYRGAACAAAIVGDVMG